MVSRSHFRPRLCVVSFALASLALVWSATAEELLQIQVSPQVLVLSSAGEKLTVHTNVPYTTGNGAELFINGVQVNVGTFADDCGNLVARCSREAAKDAVGDFNGKTTTTVVRLEVYGLVGEQTIVVKK